MNIRALFAEAFGTFILVLFGSFGVLTTYILSNSQGVEPLFAQLIVPFCFGFGLLAAIAIGGHVSGGHFNPAVTLAALFDGRVTWQNAIGYVIAQIGGAIVASLTVLLISSVTVVKYTVNNPGPTVAGTFPQQLHAVSVEGILTMIFVAVILTITKKQPTWGIFVIPFVLAGIHFAAIPISGASVNPARSIGPAIVSGTYDNVLVYIIGPLLGSILGWAVYRFLTPAEEDEISVDEVDDLDDDVAEAMSEFDDVDELGDADVVEASPRARAPRSRA
jgi:MIP family channel proteins